MDSRIIPFVDAEYKNTSGEVFIVIGRGTGGIVIEYLGDGRVELISTERWPGFTSNRRH